MDRVVATSSVSPVSTGQLFPSLVACLELPISAIAHQTPMQGPPSTQVTCWNLRDGCKQCKKYSSKFSSQQLSVLPSKQLVSQASSAKGMTCEISEQSESRNQCCTTQWAEMVDIHTEAPYWPKNGLRSNLTSKNFWDSMHPEHPSC